MLIKYDHQRLLFLYVFLDDTSFQLKKKEDHHVAHKFSRSKRLGVFLCGVSVSNTPVGSPA